MLHGNRDPSRPLPATTGADGSESTMTPAQEAAFAAAAGGQSSSALLLAVASILAVFALTWLAWLALRGRYGLSAVASGAGCGRHQRAGLVRAVNEGVRENRLARRKAPAMWPSMRDIALSAIDLNLME